MLNLYLILLNTKQQLEQSTSSTKSRIINIKACFQSQGEKKNKKSKKNSRSDYLIWKETLFAVKLKQLQGYFCDSMCGWMWENV